MPQLSKGKVYAAEDLLEALGVATAKLAALRYSTGGTVRLVLDFSGLKKGALEPLRQKGTLGAQGALTLNLPPLLLAKDLPPQIGNLKLSYLAAPRSTRILVHSAPATYNVFPLANPTRLVIDLKASAALGPSTPQHPPANALGPDALKDAREVLLSRLHRARNPPKLAPGITLKQLRFPTLVGESQVDYVEIAPRSGRFGIGGSPQRLATPQVLAQAASVAINASYFDPQSGRSIGFLKQDNKLISLPSRNRAAIGFGFGAPLIGRPQAVLRVQVNGLYVLEKKLRQETITLYTKAESWVGSPRQGAIVVAASGKVLENKVGPRRVPPGGFVLSYLPLERQLARVNAGDTLRFTLDLKPSSWNFVSDAVEAGPLLLQNARVAYAPTAEAFKANDPESNVNRRTTRAAIGVAADGRVILLIASEMTSAELVPLLASLGAKDALQLDSGGSSTLVVGGEVINRPAAWQREVATVIRYLPDRLSAR